MTKTYVKYALVAIAICGTLAVASTSPVPASDALEFSPDYASMPLAGQTKDAQPAS